MKTTTPLLMVLILIFTAARAAFPAGDPAPIPPLPVPANSPTPPVSAAPSTSPVSSVARADVFPLLFLGLAAITAVAAVTALVLVIRDRKARSSRSVIAAVPPPLPNLLPTPLDRQKAARGGSPPSPPAPTPVVEPPSPPTPVVSPDLLAASPRTMIKPAPPPAPTPVVEPPSPPPGQLSPNPHAPTEFAQLQPRLTGAALTEPYRLIRATTRIGRAPGNEVALSHGNVSSLHATIDYRDGSFYLEDQRSTNRTRLNGKLLQANQAALLKNGDRIQFATHELKFSVQGGTLIGPVLEPPEPDPPQENDGGTIVKSRSCPNHPAWQARELCDTCKRAFCPQCVIDVDGRTMCIECSEKAAAFTPKGGRAS